MVASLGLGYQRITSESRLRNYAEIWLEGFTGGDARIERVEFDLFRGMTLVGVTVAVPEHPPFNPGNNSLEARTIFRSSSLFLRLRPLSVITGDLVVPEVVAVQPELTLVRRLSDGLGNWQAMLSRRPRREGRETTPELPRIRLRNARLGQFQLDKTGRSGGSPQIIYAEAQPGETGTGVYEVLITKVTESDREREAAHSGETGNLTIDMRTLAVAGRLPTMTIEELLFTAPPAVVRWLDVLDLQGLVRPETFALEPDRERTATLNLREASLSIPLDADEYALPSDERYVQLSDIAGTIEFDGPRTTLDLSGRFSGSRVEARGAFRLPEAEGAGLDQAGFDLELHLHDVVLPRQDESRPAAEVRFVRRWSRLREFVEDFDGQGRVDLTVQLRRRPGRDEDVELVEATLEPRGASGRYVRFPYRLYDLGGLVKFRADGWTELHDVSGVNGDGRVTLNGEVGGFASTEARLDIVGENITLNEELRQCLSERDRALCDKFGAQAKMDLRVTLERAPREPDGPWPPWRTAVDVTFRDGRVCFEGFPYPLRSLTGRMRIDGQGFDIEGLRASANGATVQVSGKASRAGEQGSALDLELTARNLPLDETLTDALPADARARLKEMAARGRVDLEGRIHRDPEAQEISYTLTVSLAKVGIKIPETGLALEDLAGKLIITPDKVEATGVHGRYRGSELEVSGVFGVDPADPAMVFDVKSPGLSFDERLYADLPKSLREVWDRFMPYGRVGIEVHCRRTTTATPSADADSASWDYRVIFKPNGCIATYAGFPLPLSDVRGRVVLEPGKVTLAGVRVRHEDSTIELNGGGTWDNGVSRLSLRLKADGLPLNDALRRAVPWRLRKLWNEVQPSGTVDLDLEKLEVTSRPDQPTVYGFTGRAMLHAMALSMGASLTDLTGTIAGEGGVDEGFHIAADLALDHVSVSDHLLTEVTARLVRKKREPLMRFVDLFGNLHGGSAGGDVEIDYGPGGPRYGINLSMRDVALQGLLEAERKPDEEPVELRGQVEGNLALAGRLGDPTSRRGKGSVVIREAEMFKIPLILAVLQVLSLSIEDDNAFQDGVFSFIVDGDELILEEIDLRGRALSMVGAGRVNLETEDQHLILLVGSPLRLPRLAVLSELVEGVARELMEVHVEGTLDEPTFRADLVRSVRQSLETILNLRRKSDRPQIP